MKKAIIISIAVILLAVLAVGIFAIPVRYLPAPLTVWENTRVAKAMGDNPEVDPYIYYFGKYNGYYIVASAKMTCDIRVDKIGDYSFCINTYSIGVWKDGIRMDLQYAYEHDMISDQDLSKIHEYHLETLRDFELEFIGEE